MACRFHPLALVISRVGIKSVTRSPEDLKKQDRSCSRPILYAIRRLSTRWSESYALQLPSRALDVQHYHRLVGQLFALADGHLVLTRSDDLLFHG